MLISSDGALSSAGPAHGLPGGFRRGLSFFLAFFLLPALLVSAAGLFSQRSFADAHKNDTRAVWISTIFSLDYPSAKNDPEAQKKEFIRMLDRFQSMGLNTVAVQVRPKADAFYPSALNPWSESLTGVQGKDPGYDPLAFMLEETHKRGMSFHAWLNPYRITTRGDTDLSRLSADHPARLHPDWVMEYNKALYYNPESPGVKEHIAETVREIVQNYPVDAIHFDDYFYPSGYPLPEGESRDGDTAQLRRDTVNEMVRLVHRTIQETNPAVRFGISPMGIWKNRKSDATGSDTSGAEAYYHVFSDCRTWIREGSVDYIVPQIYWVIGHPKADYATLVRWWSDEVKNTSVDLYIGQASYVDAVAAQTGSQLAVNQKHPQVRGSFFFRAKDLLNNRQNTAEQLQAFYGSRSAQALPSAHLLQMVSSPGKEPSRGTAPSGPPASSGAQAFEAYNINGYNYFKLRDIAARLSGTAKQFNPVWDGGANAINLETGTPYAPVGGELSAGDGRIKQAVMTTASLSRDGTPVFAEAFNIDGYNYYKLRDLGRMLNFSVVWDPSAERILVDPSLEYTEP